MEKEPNLELVLTKAFLEVDKALARHMHFTPNGRFFHVTCTYIRNCAHTYAMKLILFSLQNLTYLSSVGFEALDFSTDIT